VGVRRLEHLLNGMPPVSSIELDGIAAGGHPYALVAQVGGHPREFGDQQKTDTAPPVSRADN
jgi:hypothetical protein